jgi:hypothetical protein
MPSQFPGKETLPGETHRSVRLPKPTDARKLGGLLAGELRNQAIAMNRDGFSRRTARVRKRSGRFRRAQSGHSRPSVDWTAFRFSRRASQGARLASAEGPEHVSYEQDQQYGA